jgi:hypothetical protein
VERPNQDDQQRENDRMADIRDNSNMDVGQDPRTGRPLGDHGTALQAIDWILNHCNSSDRFEIQPFLKSWMEGDLDEWPEFYEWLSREAK